MSATPTDSDLAFRAFLDAHGRLHHALAGRDVAAWYAALGETLWWVFSLDEHYRHHFGKAYEKHRDDDSHGQVILGLRFARNKVGHQLALLVADPSGRSVFDSAANTGFTLGQLVWRRSGDILGAEKQDDPQRRCYDRWLAENPVRYGIRHANYFFIRRRDRLDELFGF